MRAEIIATGTELLAGGAVETNSLFLAEGLRDLGIATAFKTVVGDDEKDMEEALRRARERVEVVIVTGGLGPTEDDITRKVAAKIVKKRLILSEDALRSIKAFFASRGRRYASTNDRQALVPAGAKLLPNAVGVAPGFFLVEEGCFFAVLPGVPAEMEAMFRDGVHQELRHFAGAHQVIRKKTLRTSGLSESRVDELIRDVMKRKYPVVGLTAKERGVDILIVAEGGGAEQAQAALDRAEEEVRARLGDSVYGVDGQELEEVVGALLLQRRMKLATAESCTGGMIGMRLTSIAGSSEYFERGVVAYSNASKVDLLGVPAGTIDRHGAVSAETASAMAEGVRQRAKTDLGLSVTGIAGPGGGTAEKPVGLVYIGLASAQGVRVQELRLFGDRDRIRIGAVQAALDMVRRHLIG